MPIEILSPDVVGKIAAGEVVERPASVVKELVENSLDAGARSIHVEIAAGGCDLIRVADDGCGISRDELQLALRRHATSKIRSANDLARVGTLGFRGEALASIAAVSDLTLVSRRADSASAHQIRVEGGAPSPVMAVSRAPGTTVTVERLFGNVPARRKFLRSAPSEAAQVAQLLSQFALSYPEVALSLLVDGRRSLAAPGTGNPVDAAIATFGKEVAAALLPVGATVRSERLAGAVAARVCGYVAEPGVSRSTRAFIWLTVNRRPVKSRTLAHAVEEGYATLLQVGRHPVALLALEVPGEEVDVNVHPTKAEVRLLRERLIYGGVRDAVRAVLAEGSSWGKPLSQAAGEREAPSGWDGASTARLIDAPIASGTVAAGETPAGGRRLPILRLMGQIAQTYIVAEGEQGLYLVDQHAAHERVLLERLKRSMGKGENTQLLLEPVPLALTAQQWAVAESSVEALESLGYRVEPFGERSLLIRGIPGELPGGRAVQALEESLQELAEETSRSDWTERMAVSLSCRGAVKAGQSLTVEEMRSLLEALEETDITQNCSHGRPTAILISHMRLEREFGRR